MMHQQGVTMSGGGLAEMTAMTALFREEREQMEAKAKAEMAELKAELQAKDEKMEVKMEANDAKLQAKMAELATPAPEAISDEQVSALQARLEGLHETKLLADEVRAQQSAPHERSEILTCGAFAGVIRTRRPRGRLHRAQVVGC